MDYEKAYKEALKRAKQVKHDVINIGCKMDPDMLDIIFPELAESEDERIRKELLDAFAAYDIDSSWNGIPVSSVLSWLERQKEQKPVEHRQL